MEIILARKLSDMSMNELVSVMMKLQIQNKEAFDALVELIEDEI